MKQAHALPAVGRRRRAGPVAVLVTALVAGALLLTSACGSSAAGQDAGKQQLRVFAASSLTEAFTRLGEQFTEAHPTADVVFSFAGSQDLVGQLQQGAPADVLASADTASMGAVSALVGAPQDFATNRMAIIVPAGNPMAIRSLADLARPGVKVVLAAPEVPAGKYAAAILQKAGVTVKPVSLEESAKGVATKVSLDEADAGIVYVTDAKAAGAAVEAIDIPAAQNVTAVYPIATVRAGTQAALAKQFVEFVLSPQGQATLQEYGFSPPAGP